MLSADAKGLKELLKENGDKFKGESKYVIFAEYIADFLLTKYQYKSTQTRSSMPGSS